MDMHTTTSSLDQEDTDERQLPREFGKAVDLTARMRAESPPPDSPFDHDDRMDTLFGAVARVLHRAQSCHVFLVGEPGTGLTTTIAEFARRAARGEFPFLRQRRFLTLDCRYTFPEHSQQRLLAILTHFADQGDLVLCIEGFASLMQNSSGETNKAALLTALWDYAGRVIALLTPREYERVVGDDAEILEFFARIDVEEPDMPTAHRIAQQLAAGLERSFDIQIEERAVQEAVVLSANYILNQRLPGKAVTVLHRVCEDVSFERNQLAVQRDAVGVTDVVRVVSEMSGVPETTLSGIGERCDYEASLRQEIFGQDHAVKEVATELGLIKAGLTDSGKPASVMLFVGQTGTGKTEMAKALARFYSASKRLRTYTLGNFVEPHSVAGIIGVPPGYVGHDQGGRIVNDLNSDPYCVFLLDEADKAHPDVLQPFLNLFDEGWIRDQRGAQGFAERAIFILTTNVGQRMLADMAKQGKTVDEMTNRMKETLAQVKHSKANRPVFAPEFLARIKRIVIFKPLDQDAMIGISRKLFRSLQDRWQTQRRKKLRIPDGLVEFIGKHACRMNDKSQGREGGRIVRKLIADLVETRIQKAIVESPQQYQQAHTISVSCDLGTSANGADPLANINVNVTLDGD